MKLVSSTNSIVNRDHIRQLSLGFYFLSSYCEVIKRIIYALEIFQKFPKRHTNWKKHVKIQGHLQFHMRSSLFVILWQFHSWRHYEWPSYKPVSFQQIKFGKNIKNFVVFCQKKVTFTLWIRQCYSTIHINWWGIHDFDTYLRSQWHHLPQVINPNEFSKTLTCAAVWDPNGLERLDEPTEIGSYKVDALLSLCNIRKYYWWVFVFLLYFYNLLVEISITYLWHLASFPTWRIKVWWFHAHGTRT